MSDTGYLIDTSVRVALAFPTHSHHPQAVDAFALFSPDRSAIFCRATQQSFLRIARTPAILRAYGVNAFTNRDAGIAMIRFLELPGFKQYNELDLLLLS